MIVPAVTTHISPLLFPLPRIMALGFLLSLAGCGGSDSSAPPPPLTRTVLETSLSATEADRLLTVVAAADGRYYATGFDTVKGDTRMVLVRLTSSGSLDPSFGDNGIARINVAVGGKTAELARGLAVQSDGKIVIAGPIEHDVTGPVATARDTDIAVVRFDSTGQLDPTFGSNGLIRLDLSTGVPSGTAFRGDTVWGLTRMANDDLLVIGGRLADGVGRTDIDYAVIKLTAHGALDTTFGTNGVATVDVGGGSDNPRTALVQPDGKIVVSGHTADIGLVTTSLFRLLPNGQLDPSFGQNGIVNVALLPFVAEAYDVAFQDSNLVVAGYGRGTSPGTVDIISARFLANGSWDRSYGDNGLTMIDVAGQDDRSRKLEVLPDGRVLIVGQGKPTAASQEAAIVVLSKDGKRDTTLNGTGVELIDFGGPTDALFGLALSPDKTSAMAVGWKGVDAAAVSSTNNDDARAVRLSLSKAQ